MQSQQSLPKWPIMCRAPLHSEALLLSNTAQGRDQNQNQNKKLQTETRLTHIDSKGHPQMVSVGDKSATHRVAMARGRIRIGPEAFKMVVDPSKSKKGSIMDISRLAGIQGAKWTSTLIPLCHNITLDSVSMDVEADPGCHGIVVTATVECFGKTGVEMEALTAVSIATLTVYDMVKSVAKDAVIEEIRLVKKSGGKSGVFISAI